MDVLIFYTSVGLFGLFLATQSVLFRFINQKAILHWLLVCYGLTVLMYSISMSMLMKQPQSDLFVAAVSLLIFTLFSGVYVLGFLGVMISSIRIEIFMAIAKTGKQGVKISDFKRIYSRKTIVAHRLSRFLASSEIKKAGTLYHLEKPFSYFRLHGFIVNSLRAWYKKTVI